MGELILTGFGWAMIKLKRLEAFHVEKVVKGSPLIDSEKYVKVYIDGEEKLTAHVDVRGVTNNIDQSYTSRKIQKNSTEIRVKVIDVDGKAILTTSGTVKSYMENPKRCSEKLEIEYTFVATEPNCLVVDVIWQDERNEYQPETSTDDIEDKCAKKHSPRPKSRDRANRQMCKQIKKNGVPMSEELLELCKKYTKDKKP